MLEIKPKLKHNMPPSTARKKWGNNPSGIITRKNRHLFKWKFPDTVINRIPPNEVTGFSKAEQFTRADLWEIMDIGNWMASDVAKLLKKPCKTIKRWANRNKEGSHPIPLTMKDYEILFYKVPDDKRRSLPLMLV